MWRVFNSRGALNLRCQSRAIRHFGSSSNNQSLIKTYVSPITISTLACGSIFTAAAFVHEREREEFWKKLKKQTHGLAWSKLHELLTKDDSLSTKMWEAQKKLLLDKKEELIRALNKTQEIYEYIPEAFKKTFLDIVQTIISMTDSQRTVSCLIALNFIFFGAWQIPYFRPFMNRHFVHNPVSGRYITLITSVLAHRQIVPFALNSIGLWTIAPCIHDMLGREQFIALYLSLGISSTTISHVVQAALYHKRPITPISGIGGSVYGLLGSAAISNPAAVVLIPFLPSIPMKISYVTPALIGLDATGIALRWRMFDHISHLAGLLLGASYIQFGPNVMWPALLKQVQYIKKQINDKTGNGKGNGNDGGKDPSDILMEIPQYVRQKIFGKKPIVPEKQ